MIRHLYFTFLIQAPIYTIFFLFYLVTFLYKLPHFSWQHLFNILIFQTWAPRYPSVLPFTIVNYLLIFRTSVTLLLSSIVFLFQLRCLDWLLYFLQLSIFQPSVSYSLVFPFGSQSCFIMFFNLRFYFLFNLLFLDMLFLSVYAFPWGVRGEKEHI